MDILDLIKIRSSTRNFKTEQIKKKYLTKILDAGIWGPSLAGKQPGKFLVISDIKIKNKIFRIVKKQLGKMGVSGKMIFAPTTLAALKNANTLIAVYNTRNFSTIIEKFSRILNKSKTRNYVGIAEQAEISAISAAIQNMILVAEDMGIGSCWLHMPLYCEKEINTCLRASDKLLAMLALGYPAAEKTRRSARKPAEQAVIYLTGNPKR